MSELASTVSDHVGADPPITRTGAGAAATDPASAEWLSSLRNEGPSRDEAIERLHALLLRGARFEVGRRQARCHTSAVASSTTSPWRPQTTR